MGTLPAMNAASRLTKFADLRLLVLLGLAGAVDSDVQIGDVVVADEANEYQASAKAQSTSSGYEVQYSGRHWSLEYEIKEAVRHFEHSCPDGFQEWQEQISHDYDQIHTPKKESVCSLPATLHVGPIASGNIVAASAAFLEEVRRINRKFLAIDMETAGVAFHASERINQVPWLVIRGVSDRGDEEKASLDQQDQVWRRYSVRNAANFLRQLLDWDHFRLACGIKNAKETMNYDNLPRQLLPLVRNHVGASWLVGIAFGLYSYGVHISVSGNAVPMDLRRLRTLDIRVDQLITQANELRDQLVEQEDLQTTAERFMALSDAYRVQLHSDGVETLLSDFDQVVAATLGTGDNEQIGPLLLEAQRLYESVGPNAVVEFLKDLHPDDARLRHLYIDSLAALHDWSTIVSSLQNIDHDLLSRGELESLISAHASGNDLASAQLAFQSHTAKYNDSAGLMYRTQIERQFPALRERERPSNV